MIFRNSLDQYVKQTATKAGHKVWIVTMSKEDVTKAMGDKHFLTIRIYPDNTPKKDKNGNDYIIGQVSAWTPDKNKK